MNWRERCEQVIGWGGAIGLPVLLFTGLMIQREAETAVVVRAPMPFSQRMGCSSWRPGYSRTVTIHAIEDEHGNLTRIECHRYRDRGRPQA